MPCASARRERPVVAQQLPRESLRHCAWIGERRPRARSYPNRRIRSSCDALTLFSIHHQIKGDRSLVLSCSIDECALSGGSASHCHQNMIRNMTKKRTGRLPHARVGRQPVSLLRRQRTSQRTTGVRSIQRRRPFLGQDAKVRDREGDGLPHGKVAAAELLFVHARA